MCWPQIARDVDLHEQIGKDIFFDLVDHDKVRSFRIQKQTPFVIFKVWPILLCN
jgi:ubiquitin carboxyl-terminal hydrolase 7